MIGQYFEYQGNVYKIVKYSSYEEAIVVKDVAIKNAQRDTNEEHAYWLERGKMWPELFFDHATIIPNGELLYAKG